jgi:hypothetical protein
MEDGEKQVKVVAKPIETIVWFTEDGIAYPIKFKIKDDSDSQVIAVHQIVQKERERLAGNDMIVYRCQSTIDGEEKLFELKYELKTCKWMLWKM